MTSESPLDVDWDAEVKLIGDKGDISIVMVYLVPYSLHCKP